MRAMVLSGSPSELNCCEETPAQPALRTARPTAAVLKPFMLSLCCREVIRHVTPTALRTGYIKSTDLPTKEIGTKGGSRRARPNVRSWDRCGRDWTRALCEIGRS